jgi:hypothetical protein
MNTQNTTNNTKYYTSQTELALEMHKALILTQIGNARMALRKETDAREAAVAALDRIQGDERTMFAADISY